MLIKTKVEKGKDLVKIVEEAIGSKPTYLGPPNFSYVAEGVTITRSGDIDCTSHFDELMKVLEEKDLLLSEGALEIKVPIDDFDAHQLMNLIFIMYSRQKLINSALGEERFYVDDSLIEFLREDNTEDKERVKEQASRYKMVEGFDFSDDCIVFKGFPVEDSLAYSALAAMIVSQARNGKRAIAKVIDVENEKYAARVWLNQIGLSGKAGKETRDVILKNLKGDAAFRTPECKERWNEKRRNK